MIIVSLWVVSVKVVLESSPPGGGVRIVGRSGGRPTPIKHQGAPSCERRVGTQQPRDRPSDLIRRREPAEGLSCAQAFERLACLFEQSVDPRGVNGSWTDHVNPDALACVI